MITRAIGGSKVRVGHGHGWTHPRGRIYSLLLRSWGDARVRKGRIWREEKEAKLLVSFLRRCRRGREGREAAKRLKQDKERICILLAIR